MAIYQVFVKHLDGRTLCLQFPSPTVSGETLKHHLTLRCHLPLQSLRLISGTREVSDQTVVSADSRHIFPSLSLLPRLLGGKGGFGSLLRGAASKAGQKKTNNFDACRDMSGRRLRHVNAEKRLEEWKAEAEERKLEKLAENFLKKKAKEGKKSSDLEVEKYLEKYRKDAERCVGEVEESVKESFELYKEGKRKVLASGPGSSKRLKIWMGKKKVEDSDSDTDDEEEKISEDTKSVIIDDGNSSSSSDKSEENSNNNSSPVSGSPSNGELSGRESLETISEEENIVGGTAESDVSEEAEMESNMEMKSLANAEGANIEVAAETPSVEVNAEVANVEVAAETPSAEVNAEVANVKVATETPSVEVNAEVASANGGICGLNEPLNFDNYSSPAELEVLGMERLKYELQKNGLKCGGTLQERAGRLFLLKTTPLDKLPKKILARPLASGK
ncbi:protein SDE2 [Carex littledalei]|uniref:Protein SDE2 n=1 Tax=Carex littledalei TaxID=544730 RepID=A0A833R680_9POAL|nr:protein SDE2 [Carex littledalei]